MFAATVVFPVLAGALAGLLVAVLVHRRYVEGMRALLDRLERLAEVTSADGPGAPQERDLDIGPIPNSDSSLSVITGDVLAGRTTHVRELLEGGHFQGLPLADQAVVRIYDRIEEPLSPSDLAESLHVSLRSLERGLSLALDCSPRELILAAKMREARRLLQTGELNVTGVSYRLGFSSPSHFSRRFRSFFKQSPSDAARRVA